MYLTHNIGSASALPIMTEFSNFIYSHKIHVLAVSETWLSSLDSDGDITTWQILFSFSTDKDRRTDSRIRRKNTAQPRGAALCFFVWSGCQFFYLCRCWKRREFDRNDPDKSEFTITTWIPGTVPKDRNTKGGGVCIFLSNQLSGKRRSDLEDPDLELLWVEMKLSGHHRSLFVGCCFRPPPPPPLSLGSIFLRNLRQISTRWLTMIFFFLATLTLKTLSGLMEIARIPMVLLWRTWRIILILHSSADKQRTLIMMENLRVY